jgi:hypothetical protein
MSTLSFFVGLLIGIPTGAALVFALSMWNFRNF